MIYGRQNLAGNQPHTVADGIINPPIDELLEVVDSKYRLVIMAAKRARQINAYYSQLGEGLLEVLGRAGVGVEPSEATFAGQEPHREIGRAHV